MTDSNATELLPCPFCGGEAEIVTIDPWYENAPVGIGCSKCSVIIAEFSTYKRFSTEAEAREAWNTRTPEQAIAATLGSGTCEMRLIWTDYEDGECYECSTCKGNTYTHGWIPNYCSECGAKVKAVKR